MSTRNKFAKHTEKMRSMLPFWLQMKKQPSDSVGLQFLNFFGMELDDVKQILEYAYRQNKIMEADEKFVDIVYKAILPTYFEIRNIDKVKVNGSVLLSKSDTLYHFFGLAENYEIDEPIHNPDYYFVDVERKIIYVREPYDKTADMPDGQIDVILKDGSSITFELSIHHVWNFFDEFGALLSCPRLHGETNVDYKQRILDVFRYPANSTKLGLANGISRELGIRKHKIWTDPSQDFIIKDKMVIANQITVGDRLVSIDKIYISPEGWLVLLGTPGTLESNLEVSYISGLELVALTDRNNVKFSNETINADGTHTDAMSDYIKNIRKNSSILWGDFLYGEGVWVKDDSEFDNDHFNFIPATLDSKIKGFAQYGFFNKEG